MKIVGAIFIIFACGSVGFQITAAHKKTEKAMRQLLAGIELISQELQYRMSPLPLILKKAAENTNGTAAQFFAQLSDEIDKQVQPNISHCVEEIIASLQDTSDLVKDGMTLLGKSLGAFDIEGQVRALDSVHNECSAMLSSITNNQDVRLRNYQTIALCAGIAVAIIFI